MRTALAARTGCLALAACLAVAGCHSSGAYGHSPSYAPLPDETAAIKGARAYDPVMFQRDPEGWRAKPAELFGVVTARGTGPAGDAYLTVSVRGLEPRNLCDNQNDDDTCRVTVSDRDFGVVHALVSLKGEDDVGEHSVGGGSLLRIVGKFGEDVDPQDGAPILRASYYRHWPRYFYVTKASAAQMRQ
jgi:hypothetical protein